MDRGGSRWHLYPVAIRSYVLRKKALTRRQILQAAAAGAASAALVTGPSKVARAQEEPQVIYDGFNLYAKCDTPRIGSWPGFWEDRWSARLILDQMQEEFNCQISYDGVFGHGSRSSSPAAKTTRH